MTVGIQAGSSISEVGASSFFNAFFSTLTGLLEPEGRGTRFPVIAGDFYEGHISSGQTDKARSELVLIQAELAQHPPSAVIWDFEDRTKQPPWGDDFSPNITSMANYFVSSTGRDMFELMLEVFDYADRRQFDINIVGI
jgi:hypothetical protein